MVSIKNVLLRRTNIKKIKNGLGLFAIQKPNQGQPFEIRTLPDFGSPLYLRIKKHPRVKLVYIKTKLYL